MSIGIHHPLALLNEGSLDVGHMLVLGEFQATLDTCVENWRNGKTTVVLSEDLEARYGMALSEYFRNTLIGYVGTPVTLGIGVDNGGGRKTFVHMPKCDDALSLPQVQPTISPLTVVSEQGILKPFNAVVGAKKAPRPMNCWIIFRDVMHKQLKVKHPELSVQEISTRCSEIWRSLSPSGKKPWQAAAKAAKEEHFRQHPNYKYSPRKPGEKKKRQSRKAKQAATGATVPDTFNFASVPDMTALTFDTDATDMSAFDASTANVDNVFASSFAQLTGPNSFFGLQHEGMAIDEQHHDAESLRHDRLQDEFNAELHANISIELFGEEAYAFRAGADGNATLPSIYSDGY